MLDCTEIDWLSHKCLLNFCLHRTHTFNLAVFFVNPNQIEIHIVVGRCGWVQTLCHTRPLRFATSWSSPSPTPRQTSSTRNHPMDNPYTTYVNFILCWPIWFTHSAPIFPLANLCSGTSLTRSTWIQRSRSHSWRYRGPAQRTAPSTTPQVGLHHQLLHR
jgi:hypothetical protein